MVLMRIRELIACEQHERTLVVLDDVADSRRLTFEADPEDARRLARELARGPCTCHPVFDFIMALLRSWHAVPVRVVLAVITRTQMEVLTLAQAIKRPRAGRLPEMRGRPDGGTRRRGAVRHGEGSRGKAEKVVLRQKRVRFTRRLTVLLR